MDNSKMKPNKYSACKNHLEKKNIKIEMIEEINRSDRNHSHVLIIESKPQSDNTFKFRVKHQIFNEKSYEVFKEQVKRISPEGTTIVLLHDARQQREVDNNLKARENAKTEEELKALRLEQAEAKKKQEEAEEERRKLEEEANAEIEKSNSGKTSNSKEEKSK